jgi:diguanylate cyclase (GGDEF)-like protein
VVAPPNITSPVPELAAEVKRRSASLMLNDADGDTPLLGRRDVAIAPWVVISLASLALAVSQFLRPDHGGLSPEVNEIMIAGSAAFGLGAGFMALIQDTWIGLKFRGSMWVYLLGASLLLAGLAAMAWVDEGLATVSFTGTVLTAAYLGLVFPPIWARISLVVLVAVMGLVQFLKPDANALEAASVISLAGAAWAIGTLLRVANQEAADQALLLSRSDQLTGALNRRGLLDQLDEELGRAAKYHRPFALLVIDLNGFKLINDNQGHDAGDRLLAWVGETVPTELPPEAAFGRMGGDEFAVVLPGSTALAAHITGQRVCEALAAQVGVSVGIATCVEDQLVDAYSLLQSADTALYAAKGAPTKRVQLVVAQAVASETTRPVARRHAALTYAQLRAAGGAPERYSTLYKGPILALGMFVVAAMGVVFVSSTIATGGSSFWELFIRFGGIPWILANVAVGIYLWPRRWENDDPPLWSLYGTVVLITMGISAAALSTGIGAMAPITAGLYLKMYFDAGMIGRRHSVPCLIYIALCLTAVLILGPADALWVAPFQFVLLVGAFAFGSIGRGAFSEAAATRLHLADTDGLTGLLNRRGFEAAAGSGLRDAVEDGRGFAVITFDLDDFKGVNDRLGHAAGDDLLRAVADVTTESLKEAHTIGRLGGDEFVATIPAESLADAMVAVDRLDLALQTVTGGSIGCAFYPGDGSTLDELLKLADDRAYAVKRARAMAAG